MSAGGLCNAPIQKPASVNGRRVGGSNRRPGIPPLLAAPVLRLRSSDSLPHSSPSPSAYQGNYLLKDSPLIISVSVFPGNFLMSTSTPRKKRKTTEDGLWRADDMLDRVHHTDGTRGKASRLRFSRFAPKSMVSGSPSTPSRGETVNGGAFSLLSPIPAPIFPAAPAGSVSALDNGQLPTETTELPLANWSDNAVDDEVGEKDRGVGDGQQNADSRESDEDEDEDEDGEDYGEEDEEEEEGLVVAGEADDDAEGPVVANEAVDQAQAEAANGKNSKKPPAKANNTIVSRPCFRWYPVRPDVGRRDRPNVSPPL